MLEKFISVTNAWKSFSVGLEEAVRATTIPQVQTQPTYDPQRSETTTGIYVNLKKFHQYSKMLLG